MIDFPADGYHLCATKNPIIAANAKEHFGIDNYLIFTKEYEDNYMMAGFGTSYRNEKIADKFSLYFIDFFTGIACAEKYITS